MTNDERERAWLLAEKYGGVESDTFRHDLARLEKGEPIAYVIGFSKFLGCHIDLSLRPLIPRTETEYWVEKVIADITAVHGHDAQLRFLDVFSGSGCIGIALLKHFPNATTDFADIEPAAVEQIKKNLQINSIDPARARVYQSDIFTAIPKGEKFTAVFANPPYIARNHEGRVEDSVFEYEPHAALFAEENGMALVRRTILEARNFIVPGGSLHLEFDDIQKADIERLIAEQQDMQATFRNDQFGLWRSVDIVLAE